MEINKPDKLERTSALNAQRQAELARLEVRMAELRRALGKGCISCFGCPYADICNKKEQLTENDTVESTDDSDSEQPDNTEHDVTPDLADTRIDIKPQSKNKPEIDVSLVITEKPSKTSPALPVANQTETQHGIIDIKPVTRTNKPETILEIPAKPGEPEITSVIPTVQESVRAIEPSIIEKEIIHKPTPSEHLQISTSQQKLEVAAIFAPSDITPKIELAKKQQETPVRALPGQIQINKVIQPVVLEQTTQNVEQPADTIQEQKPVELVNARHEVTYTESLTEIILQTPTDSIEVIVPTTQGTASKQTISSLQNCPDTEEFSNLAESINLLQPNEVDLPPADFIFQPPAFLPTYYSAKIILSVTRLALSLTIRHTVVT